MVLQAQQLQRTAGLPCPGLGNRGSPGVGLLGSLCTPHLPPLLSSGHPGIPSTADSPAADLLQGRQHISRRVLGVETRKLGSGPYGQRLGQLGVWRSDRKVFDAIKGLRLTPAELWGEASGHLGCWSICTSLSHGRPGFHLNYVGLSCSSFFSFGYKGSHLQHAGSSLFIVA